MGGRNRKAATADIGAIVVSLSDLLGSPIRSVTPQTVCVRTVLQLVIVCVASGGCEGTQNCRVSCLLEWVCITGRYYEGRSDGGNTATIGLDHRTEGILYIGDHCPLLFRYVQIVLMNEDLFT